MHYRPEAARRLEFLARGFCQDSGLRISVRDEGWSYRPGDDLICVSEDDLRTKGAEFCARIIAHEASHRMITRYHLFKFEFSDAQLAASLRNACEDGRVDGFIQQRFPGLRSTIERGARDELAMIGTWGLRSMSKFDQFCLGCAVDVSWLESIDLGRLPFHREVLAALTETRSARRRSTELLPPCSLRLPGGERGAQLIDKHVSFVVPRTIGRTGHYLSDTEKMVRVYSALSDAIIEKEVAPVAARFVESADKSASRLMGGLARRLGLGRQPWGKGECVGVDYSPGIMGGRMVPFNSGPCRPARGPSLIFYQGDDAQPGESYDSIRGRMMPLSARLAQSLGAVLLPRRRKLWSRGHPSGTLLDLRWAMAAERDPRVLDRIWLRRGEPVAPDPAILVLVDLSGSMYGDKCQIARDAVVTLAEAMCSLNCPFAIYGFQDELVPLLRFGQSIDDVASSALAEIPLEVENRRPGGHNCSGNNDDGPCLLQAAEILLHQCSEDRLLISISDGAPAGAHSDAQDLVDAVELLKDRPMDLVGLGLGPDTEHVTTYYPNSRANVPVEELPEVLALLVQRAASGGVSNSRDMLS